MNGIKTLNSRITVEDLNWSDWASHETLCFECVLHLDDEPAADCRNDGQGGMTFIYWKNEAQRLRVEHIVSQMSKRTLGTVSLAWAVEDLIDEAVGRFAALCDVKDFIRKNRLVCITPDDFESDGAWKGTCRTGRSGGVFECVRLSEVDDDILLMLVNGEAGCADKVFGL